MENPDSASGAASAETQPAASNEDAQKVELKTKFADARYTFDVEKLNKLRKEVPWTKDPKYFQTVALSPSATMKMVCVMSPDFQN